MTNASRIPDLVEALYQARQAEAEAKERRTRLEGELADSLNIPQDWEGTRTNTVGRFKVTLRRKMNVKIDESRLRELARVNNITPLLNTCFRWKPEIVAKEWKFAGEKARSVLSQAMEITPGKASFTVAPGKTEEE